MFKALVSAGLAATALAHGNMVTPEPRDGFSNAGLNKGQTSGPCGRDTQATKGAVRATYTEGDVVAITWQTDAAHGGTCKISMTSSTDAEPAMDANGILTGDNVAVLADTFACCGTSGQETMNVVIPEGMSTESGLIQWYWDGDSNYYNCADVAVEAAAVTDVCEAAGSNFCNQDTDQGVCDSTSGTAVCVCSANFEGDNCETGVTATIDESSPDLAVGCSIFAQGCGNGYCDTTTGECVCEDGYVDPPNCMIKQANGQYWFTMNVNVPEEDFDLDVFSAAVTDLTTVLASNDWDEYSMVEDSSSSSDDGSSDGATIGVLAGCLAAVTIGSVYAYKKKQGSATNHPQPGAPRSTQATWQKPKQTEMI